MDAFSNFVMSRPFQIEISESLEELEKALKHATTASSKERLQMLYWLKSGQVSSRRTLAKRLGRDEATITRWVRKYKDEATRGLLEVKHAPGKFKSLTLFPFPFPQSSLSIFGLVDY
ncbi:helix-turn-helix domain-containing protein [Nostoc sp. C117]|uniref:helix-turn-helix domain-containing protein n=1 Tax=Nostoc sp. C117 TaxID=3349875 RepID=UPI00370DC513